MKNTSGSVGIGSTRKSFRVFVAVAIFASVVVVLSAAPAQGQTTGVVWDQLGPDIDGESEFDRSGESVAISADGNRVAIGAIFNTDNGFNSGHVRIWERVGSNWVQVGDDIDGETATDLSGTSVAISADGNRVAIGAPFNNNGSGTDSGHVRVFDWSGIAWIQVGADIDGEASIDDSGTSVSISADGNRVAIGAPNNDGNGSNSGHVRVWDLVGSNWVQVGNDIDGEAEFDQSGGAVAISADGNRVAIGATGNDDNGSVSGHVRVWELSGSTWVKVGADIDGENAGDQSGGSVTLSADGNRVAIGAPTNAGTGNGSGHVRVFDWSGIAWIQVGADIDGESADDSSGRSVAISADGNRVAIGATGNDGNGTNSGHVRIWELSGSMWVQVGDDIDGENASDVSGGAVAMSDDGTRVAIGATDNDDNGTNSGHVRVWEQTLFCNGLQADVIIANGDVPTNGDDVIVGTPGDDLIVALAGADTICSLAGDDTVNAGAGDDYVDADDGNDTIFGLDGDDELFSFDGDDTIIGGNGDDTIDGGDQNDILNGGPGNDILVGRSGDDELFGQGGNDELEGNDGNDLLIGVDGNDRLIGGGGDDTINGGSDNDTAEGNAGNDIIFGLGGNDILNGGNDADQVFGQLGVDTIVGGFGNDRLFGNEQDDTIIDQGGTNVINGGAGNDDITGGIGSDEIFGDGNLAQAGNDTINGRSGTDLLIGFAGNDTIIANDGLPDIVNGGPHTTGDTCTTDPTDTVFNCNP